MNIIEKRLPLARFAKAILTMPRKALRAIMGFWEDIRPRYQREFVYKGAQRDEVVRTVIWKGCLLMLSTGARQKPDGTEGYEK